MTRVLSVLLLALLFDTDGASSEGSALHYRAKYSGRWPNCENIECFSARTSMQMSKACDASSKCTGFTFGRAAVSGGCLKACGAVEFGGFGEGDNDYYVRTVALASPQSLADDQADPLIEDLTMSWEAEAKREREMESPWFRLREQQCPELTVSAPIVLAAIRTGGTIFRAASLDEVIELVPSSDAYTFVHADVYAPASIGGTVEHVWRAAHLMGTAWDAYVERHARQTVALLEELDSRPQWTGLCFTRDVPQLAEVRRRVRCKAMLAESGSNIYILPRLPELAQVLCVWE